MLRLLLVTSLLFNSIIAKSQNLVLNPSFEDTVECPIFLLDGVENLLHWKTTSSVDYYNGCTNGMNYFFDKQLPATGNAYCGLYTFNPTVINSREIIEGILSENLLIGTTYYFSLKINLSNYSNCLSNKFSVKFSTAPLNYDHDNINPNIVNNYAQFYIDSMITDTLNWGILNGNFIADSAYKYISIGNFYDDNNTSIYIQNGATDCWPYYFIDDICVSADSVTCYNVTQVINIKKINNFDMYYDAHIKQIIIENPYGFTINYKDCIITDLLGKKLSFNLENLEKKIYIKMYDCKKGVYILRLSTNKFNTSKKILIY